MGGGEGRKVTLIPSMSWLGLGMTGSAPRGQLVRTVVGGVPETPGLYQHHSLEVTKQLANCQYGMCKICNETKKSSAAITHHKGNKKIT